MKKVFIGVDVQNDFCSPKGSLYVKPEREGQNVPQEINNHIIRHDYDVVIMTKDNHPLNHVSFASTHKAQNFSMVGKQQVWPDHCVQGTWGNEIADEITEDNYSIIVKKGQDPDVDSYSGIKDNDGKTYTGLEYLIKDADVYIAGYCYDVCVKATAIDCMKFADSVMVYKDLSPAVFPENNNKTKEELEKTGVIVL